MKQRYSHLLTYIGALIVFLTFITKEALHEQWKEEAEAIDRARTTILTSGWRSAAFAELKDIAAELHNLRLRVYRNDYEKTVLFPSVHQQLLKDQESVSEMYHHHLNDLEVLEKDASLRGYRKYLTDLHNELDEYDKSIEALRDTKDDDSKGKIKTETNLENLAAVTYYQPDLAKKLMLGSREMIRDAENARDQDARAARKMWWISTVLFVFGWGLGLLGKLYGVPETGGGD